MSHERDLQIAVQTEMLGEEGLNAGRNEEPLVPRVGRVSIDAAVYAPERSRDLEHRHDPVTGQEPVDVDAEVEVKTVTRTVSLARGERVLPHELREPPPAILLPH